VTSGPTDAIYKAGQTAPAAPTLVGKTATSITLNTIAGVEYSAGPLGPWQDAALFDNLTPGTGYIFYARLKETATHYASPISAASAVITTDAQPALTGTVNIAVNANTGVVTASVTGSNATNFNYFWSGGSANSTTATQAISGLLGTVLTVTVTDADGDKSGSITATATVYKVEISLSGNTGTDAASIADAYGEAGDSISIGYTLDSSGTASNTLTYSGAASNPTQVTTPGSGTSSYTVTAADASNGVITITATFAHINTPDTVLNAANISSAKTDISAMPIKGAATSGVTPPNIAGATGYTASGEWTGGVTGSDFNTGGNATYTVTLTAASGYTFAGTDIAADSFDSFFSATGAANVTAATISANTLTITFAYVLTDAPATAINIAAIPGVTAPATGATPVTAITETAQYTGIVTWSGNPSAFGYNTAYTATITLTPKTGYTLTGVTTNFFTVAGATSVSNNTDSGIVTAAFPATGNAPDATAPTGTITVGANNWNSFWNTVTFGLICKNTQTATITASDDSGGAVTVEYYLSASELTFTEVQAISTWTVYPNGGIPLNPNNRHIVYAKLTDPSNNTAYINSAGIVLYTDAAQVTANISFVKGSETDQTASVTLNGNTVEKIMNSAATLTGGTDYALSGGTITFKASYLESLTEGSHTLTVYYNPLGEAYPASPLTGSEAPATTYIALTISAAPPTVTGVTVSPATIEVQQSGTQQFGATVNGTNNPPQTVTWSVTGGTGSTAVDASGLLTVDVNQTSGSALTVTATSTADSTKFGTTTVTVTAAPPAPVYGISLDTGDYIFPAVAEEYGAQTPLSVAVTNTGNQATGPLSVALSGADAGDFAVSLTTINDIAIGGIGTFAVAPNTGLAAGPHTATVTVSGGNGITSDFDVSFTVNAAPPAPIIHTITLDAAGGAVYPVTALTGADGKLASLPTPTRSGYSFGGWFTQASGGTQVTSTTAFNADVTIYARWTFIGNTGTGSSSGGGSSSVTPSRPSSGTTVGNSAISTPAGQAPVKNPDGSATLPGGGTVTVGNASSGATGSAPTVTVTAPAGTVVGADGSVSIPASGSTTVTIAPQGAASGADAAMTVAVPGGTTIDKDGNIAVPAGKEAEISLPENKAAVTVPGGTTITANGMVTVGRGTADISLPGGASISVPTGSTISAGGTVRVGSGGATVFIAIGERNRSSEPVTQNADGSAVIPDTSTPLGATPGTVSGLRLTLAANTIVILDKGTPLGYSVEFNNTYSDVKTSDWFYGDVAFAISHGLMSGTSTEPPTFSPNTPMSRAMLVTVLYRLASSPETDGMYADFADVKRGSWYEAAVGWAAASGIAGGTGGGNFAPESDITREQAAAIFLNYAKYAGATPGKELALPDFDDMDKVSAWALDGLRYCADADVITGKPGNVFDPKSGATRAEVAAMLHRFILSMAGEAVPASAADYEAATANPKTGASADFPLGGDKTPIAFIGAAGGALAVTARKREDDGEPDESSEI
jgi:uncharacterized repeat protein (TIGR02543 family)